jgi:hypothetical protein
MKRSSSNNNSSSSVGEGVPFAEIFSTNNTATLYSDKDSLRGTQLNRSLQQQNINDPDGPNEEANLRSQNMI